MADVDGFGEIAAINVHSTIGMDSRDSIWAFGRFAHFWMTATLIRVKNNEYLVTRKILFGDSGFFFLWHWTLLRFSGVHSGCCSNQLVLLDERSCLG